MDDKERLKIVLKHLLEHNDGHLEDYRRWIELAEKNGLDLVAQSLKEAHEHVEKAGIALRTALNLMKD